MAGNAAAPGAVVQIPDRIDGRLRAYFGHLDEALTGHRGHAGGSAGILSPELRGLFRRHLRHLFVEFALDFFRLDLGFPTLDNSAIPGASIVPKIRKSIIFFQRLIGQSRRLALVRTADRKRHRSPVQHLTAVGVGTRRIGSVRRAFEHKLALAIDTGIGAADHFSLSLFMEPTAHPKGSYITMTALIQIIIALIVAGFLLWAVRQIIGLIPMDAWLKQVVDVVIMIAVVANVLFYVLIPLMRMLPGALHF